MKLREYQQEAVDAVYQHLRMRNDNPCVVLPTGTGKSFVIAQIATDAVNQWGGRVLILAHVKELLEQNAEKLQILCPDIDMGIYSAGLGSRETDASVIVAGIQSVYTRACELGKFDLIIIDEAHLIPVEGDGMYRQFLADAAVVNPNVRVVGLTATPFRLKGGIICEPENILNDVCYEAGIKEMIVNGYLSPLKSKAGKTKPMLRNLHIRAGEFVASDIQDAMDRMSITSEAIKEIVELTKDRKSVLIFTCSVDHCNHVVEEFAKYDIECGYIFGSTPADERAETLRRFKGEAVVSNLFKETKLPFKYLANVNVLTTGFDAPDVDCVILLRPTASAGLYVQMVGRGTRLAENKDYCLVLDYGENVLRHGPVDAVRPPDKRKNGGNNPQVMVKECPQCQELISISYRVCPECDYIFESLAPNINATAGNESILSGEIEDSWIDVQSISYNAWKKRGASEEHPQTLRIEYELGINYNVSEWVCPEHTGWARSKFEKWWRDRSDTPFPASACVAEQLAWDGALARAIKVKVRTVPGDKYDSIIDYELEDKPDYRVEGYEPEEEQEQEPVNSWTDGSWIDDLPF